MSVPPLSHLFEQQSESCTHGLPEGVHDGAGPASLAHTRCVAIVKLRISGAAYFAVRPAPIRKSRRDAWLLVDSLLPSG